MVHISTTAYATAKSFTPMYSPRSRDYQKNSGLSIWTTSWPYFFEVLTTWIASNKRNLKTKWCTSQQLLVLPQNRLHQCVRLVVGIIRKIVACRFEQLRDLIILLTDCRFLFKNNGVRLQNYPATDWYAVHVSEVSRQWNIHSPTFLFGHTHTHGCLLHILCSV